MWGWGGGGLVYISISMLFILSSNPPIYSFIFRGNYIQPCPARLVPTHHLTCLTESDSPVGDGEAGPAADGGEGDEPVRRHTQTVQRRSGAQGTDQQVCEDSFYRLGDK